MSRWQGRLERKQGFLGRIVDIGAELFAMSAACVRARAERAERPEGVELADLFCRQARVRIEALFDELWRNTDAADVAAGQEGAGRPVHLPRGGHPAAAHRGRVGLHLGRTGPSTEQDVRRRVPSRRLTPATIGTTSGSCGARVQAISGSGPAGRASSELELAARRLHRAGIAVPPGRRRVAGGCAPAGAAAGVVRARRASRSRPAGRERSAAASVARRIQRSRSGSQPNTTSAERHDEHQHDERDGQVVHGVLLGPAGLGERVGGAGRLC